MSGSFRKGVKRGASGLVARLWRREKLTIDQVRDRDPQRILIVRQHNQMGDMVCATPTLRAIREAFPKARIALVCAPVNQGVVRNNPHLDSIFLFDKAACRTPRGLMDFLRRLRAFRPDLAFVLNSVSFSGTSAALAAASGAAMIIGGESRSFGYDISRHAFSLEMPSAPAVDRHAVDHCLLPLEAIGIVPAERFTEVSASPGDRRAAAGVLAGIPGEGPLWILHPGAGKVANLWPAGRFAAVAARAAARGARVLILHGPADGAVVADFETALRDAAGGRTPPGVTLAPPLTVGTCVALLEAAERFLCNDTGLMHVAGAVGVPTLALFGPTDPGLWLPGNPAMSCLRGEGGDLAKLSTDDVWAGWSGLEPVRRDSAGAAGPAAGKE